MSALMVWLLLVFVPNLGWIFIPLLLMALTGVAISAVKIMVAYEYKWSDARIEAYKSMKVWTEEDDKKQSKAIDSICQSVNWIKQCLVMVIVSGVVIAAIPTRKELAAIILIPYATNNAEFQKIPENLAKKLNEYLTDFAPKNEDK